MHKTKNNRGPTFFHSKLRKPNYQYQVYIPYSALLFEQIFLNNLELLYRQEVRFFGITFLKIAKKDQFFSII